MAWSIFYLFLSLKIGSSPIKTLLLVDLNHVLVFFWNPKLCFSVAEAQEVFVVDDVHLLPVHVPQLGPAETCAF